MVLGPIDKAITNSTIIISKEVDTAIDGGKLDHKHVKDNKEDDKLRLSWAKLSTDWAWLSLAI